MVNVKPVKPIHNIQMGVWVVRNAKQTHNKGVLLAKIHVILLVKTETKTYVIKTTKVAEQLAKVRAKHLAKNRHNVDLAKIIMNAIIVSMANAARAWVANTVVRYLNNAGLANLAKQAARNHVKLAHKRIQRRQYLLQ